MCVLASHLAANLDNGINTAESYDGRDTDHILRPMSCAVFYHIIPVRRESRDLCPSSLRLGDNIKSGNSDTPWHVGF